MSEDSEVMFVALTQHGANGTFFPITTVHAASLDMRPFGVTALTDIL